ncbi:MAG TPA: hypothetical protein VGK67_20425 [Myxococcales bacterium]|jgi:hypothetical protein
MKRAMILAACGALGGILLTGWAAPSFIGWYYTPGGTAALSCAADVREAMGTLLRSQLIGGAVCAVVTVIAGLLIARAIQRRRAAKQPGVVAPPPAVS